MESRPSLRKIYVSLGVLLAVSLVGVGGFRVIEQYSWIDAVYMTAITMSTVGFGVVRELSPEGKLFSIFMILISASTFVYGITTLTTFIVEGEIKDIFSKYRIKRKVSKLTQHTIVCGLGRNGSEAVEELKWQQQPFVAIERDLDVIASFQGEKDILIIEGDATREEVLEEANIREAKGLICALSSDAINVFVTLTAREMNPHMKIVSRAASESAISKLRRAGANQIILPHVIGGRKMTNLITRPALVEFIDNITGEGNPDMHLEDLLCEKYPKLIGKTLAELQIRTRTGISVVGIKKENRELEMNVNAHESLSKGDTLYILGNSRQLQSFYDLFRQ